MSPRVMPKLAVLLLAGALIGFVSCGRDDTPAQGPPSSRFDAGSSVATPNFTTPNFTKPTRVIAAENAEYCKQVIAIDLSGPAFAAGFATMYEHLTKALRAPPPAIERALVDLKTILDAAKPAVDAGTMKTGHDFLIWLKSQSFDIRPALAQIQEFDSQKCNA